MADPSLYTRDEQIRDVSAQRPHLVILGAGASVAACPNGDATGRTLPVMANLVETLGLAKQLESAGIDHQKRNFEEVYAELVAVPSLAKLRGLVEQQVADYFRDLRLPDEPTIYDYLVMSLRPKDTIATFNWDPFLDQALARNHTHATMPMPSWLHGRAATGWCSEHEQQGLLGTVCKECGKPYEPTRLLYPVGDKDYTSDPYIESQWHSVQVELQSAFLLTIFGYGAPQSDAAAIELMSGAWGSPHERRLEEVEIIDIKPADHLRNTWDGFILSDHYTVSSDYFQSILAMHPRRSVEAYRQSLLEVRSREENWVPKVDTLTELWRWFRPLVEAERKHQTN